MGKSRFEGMEIAVREQARITEDGADNKIEIETLQAELTEIDKETEHNIAEIKATPIDKVLLKVQAKTDMDNKIKQNEREYRTIILTEEQTIEQEEKDAKEEYEQAVLDIKNLRLSLANLKETAKEKKDIEDTKAKQEYDKVMASANNADVTLSLKIDREKMNGEKRKKEIDIKLRNLKARDNINNEKKKSWEQLYKDTVEISKLPPQQ